MAVSAESMSSAVGADMALETLESGIVMPWPVSEVRNR